MGFQIIKRISGDVFSGFELGAEWDCVDTDIPGNKDRFRLKNLKLRSCGGSSGFNYWMSGSVSVNGQTIYSMGSWEFSFGNVGTDWYSLTGDLTERNLTTDTILHDEDGSRSVRFTFRGTMVIGWSGYTMGFEFSDDVPLDNIPRVSGIQAGNGFLGRETTIRLDRKAERFRDTLTWECGERGVTLQEKGEGTEFAVTFSTFLAYQEQFRTANSLPVKLTVVTYDGGTEIGRGEKTLDMALPEDVKPECELMVSAFGWTPGLLTYIQNFNRISYTMYASGSAGCLVTETAVTLSGMPIAYGETLRVAGKHNLTLTVKDERGRTNSYSKPITVLPWAPPALRTEVYRCDEDGHRKGDGSFVRIDYSSSAQKIPNAAGEDLNRHACRIMHRRRGTESWTYDLNFSSVQEATEEKYDHGTILFPAEKTENYEVHAECVDRCGKTTGDYLATSMYAVIDLRDGGRGITFGGYAEEDGFVCKMPADFRAGLSIDGVSLAEYIRNIVEGG